MSDPNSNNLQAAAAASQAITQSGSVALQGKISRRNLELAQKLNEQQRRDAIMAAKWSRRWALKDWHTQNAYNSPQQQMQRLKEAGLNPHLVYGNGADTTAGSIGTPQLNTPKYMPERQDMIDIPTENPLASYYDLQARGAQTDNLRMMQDIYRAQVNNLTIDGLVKTQDLADKKLKYEIQSEIKDQIVVESGLRNEALFQKIESEKFYRQLASSKFDLSKLEFELVKAQNKYSNLKTAAEIDKINSDVLRNEFLNANTKASTKEIDQRVANLMQSQKYTAIQTRLAEQGLIEGTPEYYKRYTALSREIIAQVLQIAKAPADIMKDYRRGGKANPKVEYRTFKYPR